MARLVLCLSSVVLSANTLAVGDLPQQISGVQAIRDYNAYSKLLMGSSGTTCLSRQRVVSEQITGGASPAGGSRRQVFTFSNAASVVVDRTWSTDDKLDSESVSVRTSCPKNEPEGERGPT